MKEYLEEIDLRIKRFLRRVCYALIPRFRRVLGPLGFLRFLERYPKNALARYVRGIFAIGRFEDLIALDTPWWRYKATDRIEALLDKEKTVVFEYGSGASTLWLAKRCKKVVSAEYDARFYEKVKGLTEKLPNVTLILCAPTPVAPGSKNPYPSYMWEAWRNFSFEAFVKAIDRDDALYDLIVVDGRSRVKCMEYALKHLKPEGLMMLDDAERTEYKSEFSKFGNMDIEVVRSFSPANLIRGDAAFFRFKK